MYLLRAYADEKLKIAKVFGTAILSGITTQIFFAFFKILVLDAFTTEGGEAAGTYQSDALITYIWVTQAFFLLSPWNVIWEDLDLIRSGNIAYELIRPASLHSMFFYRTLSHRFINTLVRAVPIVIFNIVIVPAIGMKYYSMHFNTVTSVILFLISIALAFILSTCITVCIYVITFYTTSATNFIGIFGSLATILTGNILPLYLFPDFLQTALILQPFKGLVDTPAQILTGQYNNIESIFYIGLQLFWIGVLSIVNQKLFKTATRRIVVHGG